MRLIPLFLALMLFLPLVSATSLVTPDGTNITDALIQVREGADSRDYLVSPGKPLTLSEATTGLTLLVKAGAGETFDYYAELPAGSVPETIVVRPTGLVLGEVRDAADNLIVHAVVSIDCPSTSVQLQTDGAGAFRVFLPAEQCKCSAAKEERAANTVLSVEQGLVNDLSLTLDASEVSRSSWWILFVLVVIIVAVVLIRYFFKPRDSKTLPEAVAVAAAPAVSVPQKAHFVAEDHKKALKEKEVLIVDELLLRDGKARVSELRTATKIARTSLLRCLEGLEHRGLLLKKTENGKPVAELVKK